MIDKKQYNASVDILLNATTNKGFIAAITDTANYKRVWTRDGTISIIAAIFSGNETLLATAQQTIKTIFNHQHKSGFMPSNVNVANDGVSYGGTVGRVDNPSWAVIALCLYTTHTNDNSLKTKYFAKVKKCFALLDAWEFNGKHLIYTPQSGDWADEYIHHGYTLFNQLLRVWALQLAAKLYDKNEYLTKANDIIKVVEQNFWRHKKQEFYCENLKHLMPEEESQYWLMGFNPSRVYSYFDLQANALALYLEIGTKQQQQSIIKFIKTYLSTATFQLLPSFYPTIKIKDDDMKNLEHNYAFEFRNYPNQFHNGGLWQVWNGLMVMALNKQKQTKLASIITQQIHIANTLNNSFNECIDAKKIQPCGINFCTWSAAGAVIAENSFDKVI
ncbi:MAG: glycoside hydrolase 100 family protein [Chitinophagaceae bacterium]